MDSDHQRSPVSGIAVEILTTISSFVATFDPNGIPWKTLPDCVAVSQVCSRWRNVALSFKLLWTSIPQQCQVWTEMALQRSHPLPILLYLDHSDPVNEDGAYMDNAVLDVDKAVFLALAELDRVAGLEVCYDWLSDEDDSFVREAFRRLALCPAPSLISLRISTGGSRIPDTIFAGEVSLQLRSVDLFQCILSPRSPIFRSALTDLELSRCAIWQTVDEFIETLIALPSLECLRLDSEEHDSITDPSPSSVHDDHVIHLPHLGDLYLHDTFITAMVMMRYLALPPDVNIDLGITWGTEEHEAPPIEVISPAVKAALGYLFAPAIAAGVYYDTLLIEGPNDAWFDIILEVTKPSRRQILLPHCLRFSILRPRNEELPRPDLVTLLNCTIDGLDGVSSIRVLNIQHRTVLRSAVDWIPMFNLLPHLRSITVQRKSAHGLLAAVANADLPQPYPPLPPIEVLRFHLVDFHDISLGRRSFFVALLLFLLQHQKARLNSLSKISFAECDAPQDMVDVLRTQWGGGKIAWDGIHDGVTQRKEANRTEWIRLLGSNTRPPEHRDDY